MESEVTGNCHASFGERDGETRRLRDMKVRSVPTLLSPLLSNILLDDLDKELEAREHRFVRYMDDLVILVKSRRAGRRVMAKTSRYLAQKLKLKVNREKSRWSRSKTSNIWVSPSGGFGSLHLTQPCGTSSTGCGD